MDRPIFQTIGAAAIEALRLSDGAFGGVRNALATLNANALDGAFNTTVGPAIDGLARLDPHADDATIAKVVAIIDDIANDVARQQADLPNPDGGDPDIGPVENPEPTPGPPKEIKLEPPPAPAEDLVGPDELHTIAVNWFVTTFGVTPTTDELLALAAGIGYVQGTSMPRAAVWAYLNSPAARLAVGR